MYSLWQVAMLSACECLFVCVRVHMTGRQKQKKDALSFLLLRISLSLSVSLLVSVTHMLRGSSSDRSLENKDL